MKVLHLVQGYEPAVGGTEFLIQKISERLVSRYKDEVIVFTTTSYNTEGFVSRKAPQMEPGTEVINGVTVRRFPVSNTVAPFLRYAQAAAWRWHLPRNDVLRTLYNGPFIPGLPSEIARQDVDIVAASSFPLKHMQYAVKARRPSVPVVLIGGLHPEDAWGFDRRDIYRAIRKADKYIAYTRFEREYVVSRGISPDKIEVIGAGVDLDEYGHDDGRSFRERYGLGENPVIAFVGQQTAHKGIEHLIRAMRIVWRHLPEAHLIVAGAPTNYTQAINAEIQNVPSAHQDQVLKIDLVGKEEKISLLHACDVFASPSGAESFGITYLEAWACGKPVIGTRSGAIPTVISEDHDGLLCDYGNIGELASLIVELLQDKAISTRLAKAGLAKVQRDHTWDVVTERLHNVYLSLLAGKTR